MSDDIEKWIALGRKAMACEGFGWHGGMCAGRSGWSWLVINTDVAVGGGTELWLDDHDGWVDADDHWPDLRDPGTVGHCLAMFWSHPAADSCASIITTVWRGDELVWCVGAADVYGEGSSLPEAIVEAWEAAA